MPPDRRRTNWDSPTKNRIIGFIQSGTSVRAAGAKYGMPKSTTQDLWSKFQGSGSTHARARSGRPRKVTDDLKDTIEHLACSNRRKSYRALIEELNANVSTSSVRRALHERGYRRCVAPRVPFLKVEHKEARLSWAKHYKPWRMGRWKNVIWSDECYVCLGGKSGRIFVTRKPEEKWNDDCVVGTWKQSSIRAMVWGCIALDWKGPLIVLEYPGGKGGGMTADRYQEQVLEGCLLNVFDNMKTTRPKISFQQDGAPAHTAKSTRRWLETHNIPMFPHPAQSPDVSPMEPLWNVLKNRLAARQPQPTTLEGLIAAVKEEWAAISLEEVNKYTTRMPRIVQAVIDVQGGHTKY